ncbi:MAG TPA: hypothetical protein VKU35_05890 [Candidatus Limnocylindria bacterium]|nr:hypothetical protein [Candidatus Limnocylindria bacterium]
MGSLFRRAGVIGWMIGAALVIPASAAAHSGGGKGSTSAGYDISYPQCGGPFPSHPIFGVVGVNGGLANDANSCFAGELQWALASPGQTSPAQPSASLYINTADPGPAPGVTDWPASGTSSAYGSCDGSWSTACAYIYGEQRAAYSYGLVSAVNPGVATTAPWWLDIETGNSWATSGTPGYAQLNVATIQGFMAGLTNQGAPSPIGVYSTASQWSAITGLSAATTPSALGSTPPDWVAGARTLTGAQSSCQSGGFTGARPTLAQYSSGGYDADLRCS